MSELKIKSILNLQQFDNFDEFDNFQKKLLEIASKSNMKLNAKLEYAKKFPDADLEDVWPNIEEEYLGYKSYEKEMFKVLIILFYSTLEIRLKNILHFSSVYINHNIDYGHIFGFNFSNIKDEFKTKLDINLENLEGFTELNELRLINNCLKHSEKVSEELANANNNWIKGKKIELDKEITETLIAKSKKHCKEIIKEIKKILDSADERSEKINPRGEK